MLVPALLIRQLYEYIDGNFFPEGLLVGKTSIAANEIGFRDVLVMNGNFPPSYIRHFKFEDNKKTCSWYHTFYDVLSGLKILENVEDGSSVLSTSL